MVQWQLFFERWVKFGLVGALGTVVNLVVYNGLLFNSFFHKHYLMSNTIAFLVAVTHNFLWNHFWAFKGCSDEKSMRQKAVQFFLVSASGFAVGNLLLWGLVAHVGVDERFANVLAIGSVSVLTFLGNHFLTFSAH